MKDSKKKLTQKRLKEVLHYSPDTGIFTRIEASRGHAAGVVAGCKRKKGYIAIGIDCKRYESHRLAFLYMEGYLPEQEVDHKDGDSYNTKWGNLRHVTPLCNSQNRKISTRNTSGFTGVRWKSGKWEVQAEINQKAIYLGRYACLISAALARCEFEKCCPDWNCNHQAVNFKKLRKLGFAI